MSNLKIILLTFIFIYFGNIYAQNTSNLLENILKIDEIAGIDTKVIEDRIKTLNSYICNEASNIDNVICMVKKLGHSLGTYSDDKDGVKSYSMFIKQKKWDCQTSSMELVHIARNNGFKSNVVFFRGHAIAYLKKNGQYFYIDMTSGYSQSDYEDKYINWLLKVYELDQMVSLKRFYDMHPNSNYENDAKNDLFAKPMQDDLVLSNYAAINIALGLSNLSSRILFLNEVEPIIGIHQNDFSYYVLAITYNRLFKELNNNILSEKAKYYCSIINYKTLRSDLNYLCD